jgi:hypothetical protein
MGAVQVILKIVDVVLHPLGLPWFVWIAAALQPFGAVAYALKFYRQYISSGALWSRFVVLVVVQVTLFLGCFAFFPRLAFFVYVAALPFGYYLLDGSLRNRGIERNIKGRVF